MQENEEVEMTYEDFLIYSARIGELEDIMFCIDEKVDLNNTHDESGNTALRKYYYWHIFSPLTLLHLFNYFYRHGMCQQSYGNRLTFNKA